MSIRAVFRVQCDGPCRGWLSISPEFAGREILPGMMTVEPTAVHAANWPGERAARRAAQREGWDYLGFTGRFLCPSCQANPLGIVLPKVPLDSGLICVDPRCPAGHAHFGPCPGPHRRDG